MKKLIIVLAMVLILVSLFPLKSVRADTAPPLPPPGTNLVPGEEFTQVRMVAETVTLTISNNPSESNKAIAITQAVFTMRNLGGVEEEMRARFPLSFFNGSSNGYGKFPEISSVVVKVDGEVVPTEREDQPLYGDASPRPEREEIPWAVFEVSFPPGKDVIIDVTYTVDGQHSYPYDAFQYVLETGAGWNGTIGSADVIVRLPYEVNKANVWVEDVYGYSEATQGGVLSGNEIRWHFDELEPTQEDNIHVIVVTPSMWASLLKERDTVEKNPNDGEAWGRLAKAYKEIVHIGRGVRFDPAALEIFELSRDAYEKCLVLLPKDSLWHYGYADLLWVHYFYYVYYTGEDGEGILPAALMHLQTALALDPNNEQARYLLEDINLWMPEAVSINENGFVLLGLTATPVLPTALLPLPSETALPAMTEITPMQTAIATPTEISQPKAQNPLCGSAFLLPVLFSLTFVVKKRN